MESSSIELKLLSCKDLKAFNFFQKLTAYALVYLASDDPATKLPEEQKQQQRTPTDRDSDSDGSNPEWNHETRFDLGFLSQQRDPGDLFLRFEFRHDGLILGDKLLGECHVPLADLIRDVAGVARFVSYEVRSGDGKPNGIFNFSYRLKGIGTHSSQILEGRISGYPVLAPEDCDPNQSQVQYPPSTSEIQHPNPNPCLYPTVCSVQEGPLYSPVASPHSVSSPSTGQYHYFYPPPPPPPPSSYPYPYPPPPPPPVAQPYPLIGPGVHPWPTGPYFEHRW